MADLALSFDVFLPTEFANMDERIVTMDSSEIIPKFVAETFANDDVISTLVSRLKITHPDVNVSDLTCITDLTFWKSLDSNVVDCGTIMALFTLYFNTAVKHVSQYVSLGKLAGLPKNSKWLTILGYRKKGNNADKTKVVACLKRATLIEILNSCYGINSWDSRKIELVNSMFVKHVQRTKKGGHDLSFEFTLDEVFYYSDMYPRCSDAYPSRNSDSNFQPVASACSTESMCLPESMNESGVQTRSCSLEDSGNVKNPGRNSEGRNILTPRATVIQEPRRKFSSKHGKPSLHEKHKILVWRSTKMRIEKSVSKLKAVLISTRLKHRYIVRDLDQTQKEFRMKCEREMAMKDSELLLREKEITVLEAEANKYELELEKLRCECDELSNKVLDELDDNDIEEFKKSEIEECNVDPVIPEISMRTSRNKINPNIIKGIIILRNNMNVSIKKCVPILVHIGNSVFNQKWVLGRSVYGTSRKRILLPSVGDNDKSLLPGAKRPKISNMTGPSPSFCKKIQEEFVLPNALKETFLDLKDSSTLTASILFDGMSYNRKKAMTKGMVVAKVDPVTKVKSVHYRSIGVDSVVDTSTSGTFTEISQTLRLGAVLTAKSTDPNDVKASVSEILNKVDTAVLDGASTMEPTVDRLTDWKHSLGLTGDVLYIHCNAHVVVALDTAIEKQLNYIEKFLDIESKVVAPFNAGFFKKTESTIFTMVRAIFLNIGHSVKNEEWACKTEFESFLAEKAGNAGISDRTQNSKNCFFNPKQSRFGKYSEMSLILAFNFETVKSFFEETYKSNKMFRCCSLYIHCPMFYEVVLSVSVILYHILGPFLTAVGAETQYGYTNLSHADLLIFYPGLISQLESLSKDPSPLIKPTRLGYLAAFPGLTKVKKTYCDMFVKVFSELNGNPSVHKAFVLDILPLFCEEFIIALKRQVAKFYIGENSIIMNAHKAAPEKLALTPITGLPSEHSVAATRISLSLAPTAKMLTHSIKQIMASSPLPEKLIAMSSDDLTKLRKDTKRSEQVKMFFKCLKTDDQRSRTLESQKIEGSREKLRKVNSDKDIATRAVKVHGGPATSAGDVDLIVKNYKSSDMSGLWKGIHAEVEYQKKVRKRHTEFLNDALFTQKKKNPITGGFDYHSVEVRIANLKEILSSASGDDDVTFDNSNFDHKSFKEKIEIHRKTNLIVAHIDAPKKLPPSKKPSSKAAPKVQPTFHSNIKESMYIACFYSESEEPWFVGLVTQIFKLSTCKHCKYLSEFNKKHMSCYNVRFLERHKKSDDSTSAVQYKISDENSYHVPPCQVIECLPKIEMKIGSSKKIEYSVKNGAEILEKLAKNEMYIEMVAEGLAR